MTQKRIKVPEIDEDQNNQEALPASWSSPQRNLRYSLSLGMILIIIVDVIMMDWLICITSRIEITRLTAKDQQWIMGSEC